MRPSEAPRGLRDDLQSWTARMMQIISESAAETAYDLADNWDEELPEDVTDQDIRLWLIASLDAGMRDLISWRIAYSKQRGMSSIQIANDLDKRTAGNLRKLFPESVDVEASMAAGEDRHHFESGLTVWFEEPATD